MKTVLLFLLTTIAIASNAQTKYYLQQELTQSILDNFFDLTKDKINLVKGEIDDKTNIFYNSEIEGYSSIYECEITLSSNSIGRVNSIIFSFKKIRNIDIYKNIISIFIEKNTGHKIDVPIYENFSQTYRLINRTNRQDELSISSNIKSQLNGYKQLTPFSNCGILVIFISTVRYN